MNNISTERECALTYKTVKAGDLEGIAPHGEIPTVNQHVPVRYASVVLPPLVLHNTVGVRDAHEAQPVGLARLVQKEVGGKLDRQVEFAQSRPCFRWLACLSVHFELDFSIIDRLFLLRLPKKFLHFELFSD